MKKIVNQHVTRNKKKQNRYVVEEKSARSDILDYSWCFETTLDLCHRLKMNLSEFGFSDISILLKIFCGKMSHS